MLDTLWKQCLIGDRKAQFQLYQLFSKKMFAVCLRYAQDQVEAEDILQMGFIKVFTKGELYRGQGSLEGWIRRIIVHTAIETHRRNRINFTDPIEQRHEHIAIPYTLQDNLQYQDLLALVHDLPVGYKTIFNLYAVEGYSHREIAEMLSISEGNSKSQLSRARQWLKDKLLKLEDLER
ncbi:RNA polymerase sigma factor [Sphingobacterium suaedae]|uniref:RNA polymerase sigma factor n=1 Tax=Sphingobacterium suaedae TaxID=1686402 RepID=A0ABW5KIE4_9SPHI